MWKPASPCLDCGHLNDANFKVCQRCRLRQVCSVSKHPSKRLKIDFQAIDDRLVHLAEVKSNKSYERQKSSLHKELINFLSSLPVSKALPSASPSDIKKFLEWKDNSGKTIVHLLDSPGLGQRQRVSCSCPTRLAAGTVDSLIGKLRSIFLDEGLGGEWDDLLGIENPVSHLSIKAYLKCVREEQAQARVQPREAVPLFTNKCLAIARSILSKLRKPCTSPSLLYILSRVSVALIFSLETVRRT
ncbi:Protein LIGHT-DEPENDENT SHORT HYPOCOTYLS 6 [Acropora cervicornis]|uniref:Protein LIGHT-DEPENDENT SHORT HYPOCOTYLS 6 n=1 Tax=Acropora cervicornis TaxID=6130 RepID=A0AAD9UZU1_ACRCE|nr:Protein LIGHT-DEPENDENT SHORT HYPOCOTYLS 6 [Acropora cervicornis]